MTRLALTILLILTASPVLADCKRPCKEGCRTAAERCVHGCRVTCASMYPDDKPARAACKTACREVCAEQKDRCVAACRGRCEGSPNTP
jgi:hypothetical protein